MSHEIRTPINAIIGLTDLASRQSDVPEPVRENLAKINTSSHCLLNLLNGKRPVRRRRDPSAPGAHQSSVQRHQIHTPGRVTLTVSEQPEENRAALTFSVSDTGPAIEPEDRKRIFTAFEQAGTNYNRSQGTDPRGLNTTMPFSWTFTCRDERTGRDAHAPAT